MYFIKNSFLISNKNAVKKKIFPLFMYHLKLYSQEPAVNQKNSRKDKYFLF